MICELTRAVNSFLPVVFAGMLPLSGKTEGEKASAADAAQGRGAAEGRRLPLYTSRSSSPEQTVLGGGKVSFEVSAFFILHDENMFLPQQQHAAFHRPFS